MVITENWARMVWGLQGYEPNAVQAEAVWAALDGTRFLLICGGEQAGKSFTSVGIALLYMQPDTSDLSDPSDLSDCAPTLIWVVGPDYYQARAEFGYIHAALSKGGFVTKASMPENKTSGWSMHTSWNATIETRTSNEIMSLASFAPDVVIMAEAAQQSYDVWLKLRGRVAAKRGRLIMSGTLEKGLPWYSDMLERWKAPNDDDGFSVSIPSWSNRARYPGGYNDPEMVSLRRTMPKDYFRERYAAVPKKATGLVIKEFDYKKHVRVLEVEPKVPVRLWVVPGHLAYCVLFVQRIGNVTHVLDRVYERDAIAQDVIPKAMENPLWEQVMLNKGDHGIIDIAGKHHYGLPSHVEVWRDLAKVTLRSNYIFEPDSIAVVRYRLRDDPVLKHPLIFFNKCFTNAKATDGTALDVLAEFELWKWREQRPGRSEPKRPIDYNNHGIKALGYGLYDTYGPAEGKKPVHNRQLRANWVTV